MEQTILDAPIDVLASVFCDLNVKDVETVSDMLTDRRSADDINMLRSLKLSPIKYMKRLVSRSKELAELMLDCGVVLSGSMAAEYFCKGVTDRNSDWDFYCGCPDYDYMKFLICTEELGFVWHHRSDDSVNTDDYENVGRFKVFSGHCDNGNERFNVQLVVIDSHRTGVIGAIVNFHSSIIQCFISGFAAVSMNFHLTSSKRSLRWIADSNRQMMRTEGEAALENSVRKGVQKYLNRGVKYVSYDDYADITEPHQECGSSGSHRLIDPLRVCAVNRSLFDKQSKVIPFDYFYDDPVVKQRVIEMSNAVKEANWLETPYSCTMGSGPSAIRGARPKCSLARTAHVSAKLEVLDTIWPGADVDEGSEVRFRKAKELMPFLSPTDVRDAIEHRRDRFVPSVMTYPC